jgi:hypothetical protein
MKIVKMVVGGNYYALNNNNNLAVISGVMYNHSLKEFVMRMCTTEASITDVWPDKVVREFNTVFKYETVEDLIENYPEYLI